MTTLSEKTGSEKAEAPDLSHVIEPVRFAFDLADEDRLSAVWDSIFVKTAQTRELFGLLEKLVRQNDSLKPRGMAVHGDPDAGKSFALSQFEKQHPPRQNPETQFGDFPVLRIDTPPNYSWTSTCNRLLQKIHSPIPGRAREMDLHDHTVDMLRRTSVRLVIFDEFTNVGAAGAQSARLTEYKKLLRAFVNELQRPIVVAGIRTIVTELKDDPQLRTRIEDQFELRPLKFAPDFQKAFAAFCHILPLKEITDYRDSLLCRELYDLSAGHLGKLAFLLRSAAERAIELGVERITREIIAGLPNYAIRTMRA